MFLKKFISVSVISVLFFTLVANMVCSAEYLYPIRKEDVEPEKCYTLPFKRFDAKNNTMVNFSKGNELGYMIDKIEDVYETGEKITDKNEKIWNFNEFVSTSKTLSKLVLRSALRRVKRTLVNKFKMEFRELAEEIDII